MRAQLAKAFGGVRGMIEAAVPTAAFTLSWITTQNMKTSLIISISLSAVLLLVRIVQRSTPQFVINSLIGIGIGWFFASRTGDAKDYFLPGILWNGGYAVAMLISIVSRWPIVGFIIGSVTNANDPLAWHKDPGIVRLCTKLTWLLMIPCVVRVAVQLPVWLFGGGDEAVAALGFAKIVMGWPLQVAALGGMLWLLGRGRTPIKPVAPA
ncbi:DUF3159 domain-containing protein [Nonomuraea sp. NN258]|nr:DUF3159 domain-containing protein [Nonomuraea antri]